MARIRSIKPEFWEDDAIGALSRDARLLFVATWNLADDEGLVRWSGDYLKAAVFMYDDISPNDVQMWMSEIEYRGLVYAYATGRARTRYGYIVNFRKHQRIDKPQPGRLPPPPWNTNDAAMMYARRDEFICHRCGEPVNYEYADRPVGSPYDPATPEDITGRNPSPDHVVPRSKGGSDYPTNIKTAHLSCNKGRGNRPVAVADSSKSIRGTTPGTFFEPSAPEGKGREGIGKGDEPKGTTTVAVVTPSVEGTARNGSHPEMPLCVCCGSVLDRDGTCFSADCEVSRANA